MKAAGTWNWFITVGILKSLKVMSMTMFGNTLNSERSNLSIKPLKKSVMECMTSSLPVHWMVIFMAFDYCALRSQ